MTTETERTRQIESLHRKYAGVIFDLCVRILKDTAEAEDAVQDTFLNAFRAMDSFTYGDSHLPWLYRIGTNVCLKILRTKKRKGALPVENTELERHETGQQVDPANQMAVRTQLLQLQESLDERNMEIVVSHFILGMNQQEVADSMGISRRAVVKRLARLKTLVQDLAQISAPGPLMETGENE